jgi:hypothetical protein
MHVSSPTWLESGVLEQMVKFSHLGDVVPCAWYHKYRNKATGVCTSHLTVLRHLHYRGGIGIPQSQTLHVCPWHTKINDQWVKSKRVKRQTEGQRKRYRGRKREGGGSERQRDRLGTFSSGKPKFLWLMHSLPTSCMNVRVRLHLCLHIFHASRLLWLLNASQGGPTGCYAQQLCSIATTYVI